MKMVANRVLSAGVLSILLALPTSTFASGFSLGDAANYAILYEGNGGHHLAINNFLTVWTGNIGIAGTGTLAATGPGTLNGDVNFAAANTGQASISNTTINGTVNYLVPAVQTDMNYLNTMSAYFGTQVGSATGLAINTSTTQMVDVSTANLVSGTYGSNYLFSVSSMQTNNGQDLIIKGDGSHNVVFDYNMSAQFNGNVLLEDTNGKFWGAAGYSGLTPDQVLFNFYGSGDTLQANDNGNLAHPANMMFGTFLDPNGAVSFVNTRFTGHIYGGDSTDMQIVSGDTITLPPENVPEPSSLILMTSGLLGAALTLRRQLRK